MPERRGARASGGSVGRRCRGGRTAREVSLEQLGDRSPMGRARRAGVMVAMTAERMELTHLHREVQTALELAIIALAPLSLVEHLAAAAGLLEAIPRLRVDAPAVLAIVPKTIQGARQALEDWRRWQDAKGAA